MIVCTPVAEYPEEVDCLRDLVYVTKSHLPAIEQAEAAKMLVAKHGSEQR